MTIPNPPPREPVRKPEWVICDLDSTLRDTSHRHHLAKPGANGKVDWHRYSLAGKDDTPIWPMIHLIKILAETHFVAILSGANDVAERLTVAWLSKYEITYNVLRLKADDDPQDPTLFKLDVLRNWQAHMDIKLMFDDYPELSRAVMSELGIPVVTPLPPYFKELPGL